MDSLTRYYVRKANLKVKDEFQNCISPADLTVLQKARAYIVICPIFAMCLVHFLMKVREEGGFSRHFQRAIGKVRSNY